MSKDRTFKVFLVDDDTKHLLLLKDHLTKKISYDLNIQIFSSGENAIQKLDENPDLIILDFYLDGINPKAKTGVEILSQMKRLSPELPVIMMSNQDKLEVAIDCFDNGATDYIIKNESAFLKSEIVIKNVIRSYIKEQILQDYRKGLYIASTMGAIFLLALIGIIIFYNINP